MSANRRLALLVLALSIEIGALVLGCTTHEDPIGGPVTPPSAKDGSDASDAPPLLLLPLKSTVPCDLTGIRSVVVPFDEDDPGGQTIELRYRVFPSSRVGAPTVVVVPGGPGGSIMRKDPKDSFALGAIPSDLFTVIYTDARGSGCNAYSDVSAPERGYTIRAVARDILAVVEAEKLKDYFVYAASFGTTAATVAVARAESVGVSVPRRLILEGAVGRAFATFDEYFLPFRAEWIRVKALLDPVWNAEFEKEPWSTTLFWSREQWGAFISAQPPVPT